MVFESILHVAQPTDSLRKIIITAAAALIALPAFAADESVCKQVFAVSASLISNKEKGKTEDEVRTSLPTVPEGFTLADAPSASNQLFSQMHEMINEVYGGQTPDQRTYSVYRAEKCHRDINRLKTPNSFEDVREKLAECSAKNETAIECAMMVAGSQSE